METLTRPNGKTYRARTAPRAETFYTWDECSAVVVIGTHDLEVAAGLAQRLWDYDEPLPEGRTHWWRLVPWDASGIFDRSWVDAPERGRPVVVFTPTEV
jgi:hypothetical protein